MSSQVLLYSGRGASALCTDALERQLRELVDDRIYWIRRVDIFDPHVISSYPVEAIFVGGGDTSDIWTNNIKHSAEPVKVLMKNRQIAFFGACAGGLLASTAYHGRVKYEKFPNCFLKQKTDLWGLFPGETIAPLFPRPLRQTTTGDFILQDICQPTKRVQSAHMFSPGYLNVDGIHGATVLGTYTNLPGFSYAICDRGQWTLDAIIDPKTISESLFYDPGEGCKMLLTGSHLEFDSTTVLSEEFKSAFNFSRIEQQKCAEQMKPHDAARATLLKSYFQMLGIACK